MFASQIVVQYWIPFVLKEPEEKVCFNCCHLQIASYKYKKIESLIMFCIPTTNSCMIPLCSDGLNMCHILRVIPHGRRIFKDLFKLGLRQFQVKKKPIAQILSDLLQVSKFLNCFKGYLRDNKTKSALRKKAFAYI